MPYHAHMRFHSILPSLLSLCLFFAFSCQEKDWRKELEKEQAKYMQEVAKTQEFLLLNKKDNYSIPNSANSVEEAILAFVREARTKDDPETMLTLMSEKELREILYPHVLGTGTSLDSNPFPRYEEMIRNRRKMGLERFKEDVGKDPSWSKVEYKVTEERKYGPITGYKIGFLLLKGKKREIKTEAVKMVIGHKGQFKVAVIGP